MDDDNNTGNILRHLHIFLTPKPIREVRHILHSLLSTVNAMNLIMRKVPSQCQHSAKCNLYFSQVLFLSDNLDKSRQAFSPTCSLNSSHFATENFQQPPQCNSAAKIRHKMMLQTLGGEWWGNNFFLLRNWYL